MKYTQSTLDKLEKIVEEAGYVIRYERGTFQSGYCILEQKKVVVLNKFLQTEGRINTLIDLVPQLDIRVDLLSDESRKSVTSCECLKRLERALRMPLSQNCLMDFGKCWDAVLREGPTFPEGSGRNLR